MNRKSDEERREKKMISFRRRFVLMTMINRSLSDQQSSEIANAEFRIHRCSYSYIYILAPLRYVVEMDRHRF